MSAFIAAYCLVWLALASYVLQMGGRQRKLMNKMESLEQLLRGERR